MAEKPGIFIETGKGGVILSWGFGVNSKGKEYKGLKLPSDFFKMAMTGKYKIVRGKIVDTTKKTTRKKK